MSRDHRFQQGKFENYYPQRDELRGDVFHNEARGGSYEVERKNSRDVGGTHNPEQRGTHRGKGPRNYRRSDDRILDEINDRFCDNAYIDATDIEISVSNGNVVLSGTVEDRDSKRLAEDVVESISGVENVENTLRVKVRGI